MVRCGLTAICRLVAGRTCFRVQLKLQLQLQLRSWSRLRLLLLLILPLHLRSLRKGRGRDCWAEAIPWGAWSSSFGCR